MQRLPRMRQNPAHDSKFLLRAILTLGTFFQRVELQVPAHAEDLPEGAAAKEALFVLFGAELLDDVFEASG